MVVSSPKLTILISCSPICIPLILLLALIKLTSTSAAIMYDSIENKHPCQNPPVRVNRSNRRLFTLILDWLYWCMHFQPFVYISKLTESRKVKIPIKSRDITEKFLFSLFDTTFMQQIVEWVCKNILFLIASDWFSLIVVSNIFCFNSLEL